MRVGASARRRLRRAAGRSMRAISAGKGLERAGPAEERHFDAAPFAQVGQKGESSRRRAPGGAKRALSPATCPSGRLETAARAFGRWRDRPVDWSVLIDARQLQAELQARDWKQLPIAQMQRRRRRKDRRATIARRLSAGSMTHALFRAIWRRWKNSAKVRPRLSHIAKAMRRRSASARLGQRQRRDCRARAGGVAEPERRRAATEPETADARSSGKAAAISAASRRRTRRIRDGGAIACETTHRSGVPFDPWPGPAAIARRRPRVVKRRRARASICLAGRPAKHDSRRQSALVGWEVWR